VESIAKDGVSSQNSDADRLKRVIINCWTQNTLNRSIDQLAKRLMMVIKVKAAHVEFHLD